MKPVAPGLETLVLRAPLLLRTRRKGATLVVTMGLDLVCWAQHTTFKWVLRLFKTEVTAQIVIAAAYTSVGLTVCWAHSLT